MQLVRAVHPAWTEEQVMQEAARNWESSARLFIERTLEYLHVLRPHGKFGLYAYPKCFGYGPWRPYPPTECSTRDRNNGLGWLWDASGAVFPATSFVTTNTTFNQLMARSVVREARRVAGAKDTLSLIHI